LRTLDDYCRSFFSKGFLRFDKLGDTSGVVYYEDYDKTVYADTYSVANGKPVLIQSRILTADEVNEFGLYNN